MFSLQELHSPCKIKFWWTDILNKYDKNFCYQLFLLQIKVNSNKHSNFDWLFFTDAIFIPRLDSVPFIFHDISVSLVLFLPHSSLTHFTSVYITKSLVHMEELKNKREVTREKKNFLMAVLHVCGSFSYLGNGCKV